jgi:hypothetical protein
MSRIRLTLRLHAREETAVQTLTFLLPTPAEGTEFPAVRSAFTAFEHSYFGLTRILRCVGCNKYCKLSPLTPELAAPGPFLIETHTTDEDDVVVTAVHEVYGNCGKQHCVGVCAVRADAAEKAQKRETPAPRVSQCHGCFSESDPRAAPFKRCAGCLSVRYCSVACQAAHWTQHKPLCQHVKKQISK